MSATSRASRDKPLIASAVSGRRSLAMQVEVLMKQALDATRRRGICPPADPEGWCASCGVSVSAGACTRSAAAVVERSGVS